MKNEKIVDSLVDFLNVINDLSEKSVDYFYRGESEIFREPLFASGYRSNKLNGGLTFLKKEFFREIGYSLDKDSRDNFTAFSQHHGLPTELLDITKNPLVALYFAIESSPDREGAVYVIPDHSHIIDVLEDYEVENENEFQKMMHDIYLARYSFQESGGKMIKYSKGHFLNNIYERCSTVELLDGEMYEKNIVNNNELPLDSTLRLVSYILKAHKRNILYTVIHSEKNFRRNSDHLKELMSLLDKYSNSSTKKELYQFYLEFQNTNIVSDLSIDPDPTDGKIDSDSWQPNRYNTKPFFLLFVISLCIRDNSFPPFPKIIFKPTITFDRLKNQQASFIFQVSFEKSTIINRNDSNDKNIIATKFQAINYDYKILVRNKNSIKQELDRIGINEKFIYPEVDNVAHYIKQRYGY
ncbi:FRG domain-containing protein [Leuconostoc lactis]|uniref:FRG domain-containing protein n=1 Tax=Leuconostoc lactis TaxID=1246 RepID=UPI0021C24DBB|nr:FRG domain-containing protein [Leuconostoc lactis]MCT8386894.1 FRG domain-containing protein [Leuconostoc lactis]